MKFIKKKKVLKDCWVQDEELGRIPLEISLLMKLDHPNIVAVSGNSLATKFWALNQSPFLREAFHSGKKNYKIGVNVRENHHNEIRHLSVFRF